MQEELKGLQTDFTRFKSMFDHSISVQTMVTVEDLKKLITELGTLRQAVFEQLSLTLSVSTGKRRRQSS